jgi:DNA-binding NarL/FixJ family response regulator
MISILVDHEEPLLAAGIAATLELSDDFRVARSYTQEECGVDIVVADYESGVRWARGGSRTCSILILTRRVSESEIRYAIESGVSGYMPVGCTPDELLSGLRDLSRGGTVLSALVAARLAEGVGYLPLTRREAAVLECAARGCSDKQIGQRLAVSLGTVKSHMKAILTKLGARSRTEAAAIARHRGLIAEDSGLQRGFGRRYPPPSISLRA